MPEKFKCKCGGSVFTNILFQLKANGDPYASTSDLFACLKCGKIYKAKNNRIEEVKE